MRKLLILMLVLGVAAAANAGLEISVRNLDDSPFDPETDSIAASDELWLDVHATNLTSAEYVYWALVVEAAEGTISGGVVGATPPAGNLNSIDAWNAIAYYFYPYVPLTPTQQGISGGVFDSGGLTLDGIQIDNILFHCVEDGLDAVINLYVTPTYAPGTYSLADSMTITQIPEPMTMALLGFGALLLRRRK